MAAPPRPRARGRDGAPRAPRGGAGPPPRAGAPRVARGGGTGDAGPMLKKARRDLAYLILAGLTGLASFPVLAVGLLAGAATLVIWVGVPLLGGMLAIARMLADL